MKLVLDLETIAHPDAATYLDGMVKPDGRCKTPEAIAKSLEEKTAERLEKAALDPDLTRIVAISVMGEKDPGPITALAKTEAQEAQVLTRFWAKYATPDALYLGWNIKAFDIPVLLRRSLLLGVKAPKMQLARFRHPQVLDIMDVYSFDGLLTPKSKDFYYRRLGLPEVEDAITGANVAEAYAAGDWDAIAAHCAADVIKEARLAQHVGLFHHTPVTAPRLETAV